MFFAFDDDGLENRFWKNLLKPAEVLDIPSDNGLPPEEKNRLRSERILALAYESPFRLGFSVFVSMPSSAGGPWAGVAGVRKLIGSKAMKRLEVCERARVMDCAKRFLGREGVAVAFQKDAWNNLRSEKNPVYGFEKAKRCRLTGSLGDVPWIPLLGVPPTRLMGPSRSVLHRLVFQHTKTINKT
jgi:hypothetical protein